MAPDETMALALPGVAKRCLACATTDAPGGMPWNEADTCPDCGAWYVDHPDATPLATVLTSTTAPFDHGADTVAETDVADVFDIVTELGAAGVPHRVCDVAYEDVPFEFLALTLKT
jgi:hypothetical protein